MIGRFSEVLQNAADALAPPAPLYDDFVYHWKRLMKHYLDVAPMNKVPVEVTNIPAHLDQLQKILLKEDGELNSSGSTGPCMEYLLHHNLLELLVTLAISDDPPGMRRIVLHFISCTLNKLQAPILAHNSVFPSMQRLLSICNGSHLTPSEKEEICYLFTMAAILRKHPHLVHVFVSSTSQSQERERTNSTSSETSSHLSTGSILLSTTPPLNNLLFRPFVPPVLSREPKLIPITKCDESKSIDEGCDVGDNMSNVDSEEAKDGAAEFILIECLLSYINSPDCEVRLKACQAIMLLVSLPDDRYASIIAKYSSLNEKLSVKLVQLYSEIPLDTDPNNIDDMHVSWGLVAPIAAEREVQCEGWRQAASFFAWLDFCDQIAVESRPAIGISISRSIRKVFLDKEFLPEALPNVLTLATLSKCFKMLVSRSVIQEMGEWLVGDARDPELPNVLTCCVTQALLECCSHEDPTINLEALRLFEVLLEKNDEHIVHCLVLRYVLGRVYFDSTTNMNQIESWSDEEDERERQRSSPEINSSETLNGMGRTLAPSHIEKIIQSFLNVLPPQLRSAPATEGNSYYQYISESQRQYSIVLTACKSFSWPNEAVSDDNHSSDSQPEADSRQFYEGPFLKMIFERIRNLPNQAYEVNLQLTAVISRLALLPHPYIHEFLLNTTIPRHLNADSLLQALLDTSSEMFTRVSVIPNYKAILSATRQRLLGDIPENSGEVRNYFWGDEDIFNGV
uniref:FHF complex subunit HOOK-interacting protein C-terminal domain-containing protein n=1 Tax=Clastoptera arizonana TaxID=38151 RepID=A0A1B6BXJ8_9HEMI